MDLVVVARVSEQFCSPKNRLVRMTSNQPGVAILNQTTARNNTDTDGDNNGVRRTNSTAGSTTGSNGACSNMGTDKNNRKGSILHSNPGRTRY